MKTTKLIEVKYHEAFVSLELANELKELGFDWETNAHYDNPYNLLIINTFYADSSKNENESAVAAPTLAVAQKWLREKEGVFIEILWKFENPDIEYYCKMFYKGTFYETELLKSYEDAQSAGINKAIYLIKEQIKKYENAL